MAKIHSSIKETKKGNIENQHKMLIESVLSKIKSKFLIMSGKGGVGKSSVTVNLAVALANKGYKIGIIDVDLHGPDILRMLGLDSKLNVGKNDKLTPISYNDNIKVVSVEAIMPSRDSAVIWRGPMKYSAIQQFIGSVDWGHLDFLLIDAPPGTGDEPLTVAQTIKDALAIVVTTPQEVALADVRKSINFCRTVGMKIFGLIENMSGCVCNHCNKVIDLFGSDGGKRTAIDMDVLFLGKIPFDFNVVKCGDSGLSYQNEFNSSEISHVFKNIADSMTEILKK